jgi:hypothetical protein
MSILLTPLFCIITTIALSHVPHIYIYIYYVVTVLSTAVNILQTGYLVVGTFFAANKRYRRYGS